MSFLNIPFFSKKKILALGAESEGVFAFYQNGQIFLSENFGDLLDEQNFQKFKKAILQYLQRNKTKPDIILFDLHPFYRTTELGKELAKKFKAKHIQIQHHLAHLFSSIGEKMIISNFQFLPKASRSRWLSGRHPFGAPKASRSRWLSGRHPFGAIFKQIQSANWRAKFMIHNSFLGVACDGTGYGLDGKIWGGEIFKVQSAKCKVQSIEMQNAKEKNKNQNLIINRIGSLENQVMIGGDLAIREPARMLIAILARIMNYELRITNKFKIQSASWRIKFKKDFIYKFVKKFYTRNQFELLYNQLQQGFNCQETSSAGRVLDAVSILLGFCKNERNYKHEPIRLLEDNSTIPYTDLKPIIKKFEIQSTKFETNSKFQILNSKHYELFTSPLFDYLINNLHKDKKRLAATAQLYLAQGLYEIIKKVHNSKFIIQDLYFAGGLANNKIISEYLESKGIYVNKIFSRGDAGLSFGQIVYYLFS